MVMFSLQKIKERLLNSQHNSPTSSSSVFAPRDVMDAPPASNALHATSRLTRDSWASSRDGSQSSFEVEYQDPDSTFR